MIGPVREAQQESMYPCYPQTSRKHDTAHQMHQMHQIHTRNSRSILEKCPSPPAASAPMKKATPSIRSILWGPIWASLSPPAALLKTPSPLYSCWSWVSMPKPSGLARSQQSVGQGSNALASHLFRTRIFALRYLVPPNSTGAADAA